MTSPPALVPNAWKTRQLGVNMVDPSGLVPASAVIDLKKWTEPSAKSMFAPPG